MTRTWRALGLQPHASHAQMIHLNGKSAISTQAWVLAVLSATRSTVKQSPMNVPSHKSELNQPAFLGLHQINHLMTK